MRACRHPFCSPDLAAHGTAQTSLLGQSRMHLTREGFTMHAFARMRRRRGATIAASITAVLATALTTVVTVLPASTAQAVTPVAGPIDPNTGYPFWYADSSGQKYELCLDRPTTTPGMCLAAPQN